MNSHLLLDRPPPWWFKPKGKPRSAATAF